ncbi:MAG: UvrD-helicase domain-containing protein [Burkholderiaceae bacterium]
MANAAASLAGHPVLAPGVLDGFHLIEADAGTGKTWTIARLVLRALVEKSLRIDQIVVVTFTNAAAAELKERIASLLDQWSEGVPPKDDLFGAAWQLPHGMTAPQVRDIVRLARLQLDDAPIHTIHGLCQRVLTEQAMSLGQWGEIEPGFDDDAALTESLAKWWRREIVHGPAERSTLIGRNGLLFSRLKDLLGKALSLPDAEILSLSDTDWTTLPGRLEATVRTVSEHLLVERDDLIEWMAESGSLNKRSYKPEQVEDKIAAVSAWLERFPQAIDQDLDELAWLDPRRMTLVKSGIDKREDFQALTALTVLNDLRVERSRLNEYLGKQIRQEVSALVEQRKRAARQMSFNDLLHRTQRALADGEVGQGLASQLTLRFPLALIDEFQDTDPAQWDIFRRLYLAPASGLTDDQTRALVLVGDPKQAIYSFRNADINTYLAARDAGATIYPLGQNQRSGRQLIAAVNTLFDRPDPFGLSQMVFEPAQASDRADSPERQPPPDGQGALSFVFLDGETANPHPIGKAELIERAARIAAVQIQRLLSGPGAGADAATVTAGDIAVLVRTVAQGRQVKQALAARGVGAVEVSRDSVLVADEATDLLRVLTAIADPADDRAVRGALTTTLLGFSVDDLQNMDSTPGIWDRRFAAFLSCRQAWPRDGVQACLQDLLFGFFDRASALVALPDGERRMTNLLHLIDVLADEAAANEGAVQARAILSRQRQQAIERQGRDETTEVRLESDDQLVRILTIHGSKGLEFPFVFLPYLWHTGGAAALDTVTVSELVAADGVRRRVMSLSPDFSILKNPKWGIVPTGPMHPETLKEDSKLSALQEGLRLTYVALTRASRRCIVSWGFPQPAKRGYAAPGTLADPTPDAGGIGYLLDRECTLSKRPDVGRVAETINALAREVDGVSVLTGLDLLAQANEPEQVPHKPDQAVEPPHASGPGRRLGWPAAQSMTLAGPLPNIPPGWRTSSFTGLMSAGASTSGNEASHAWRPDHDEWVAKRLVLPTPEAGSDAAIRARFVRGANAGSCLHDVLERVDFRLPVADDIVSQSLARFGIDETAPLVASWLTEVLAAPLPAIDSAPGLRLNTIAPPDAVPELDFLMPAINADPAAMVRAVASHYPVDDQLSHHQLTGFMKGFIDLVVRRDNTYWLIDWKSNWLGEHASHYTRQAMEDVIKMHGYSLQFSLYSLALHRWLARRVPDYDYESHFGGVYYIFLRGAGADTKATDNGVYGTRLPLSLICELEQLVGLGGQV